MAAEKLKRPEAVMGIGQGRDPLYGHGFIAAECLPRAPHRPISSSPLP
jgi:hypothetical protein